METIVIIGAGAIGRGFLPWVLKENQYRLIFVDANPSLIQRLRVRGCYTSFMAKGALELVSKKISLEAAYLPAEFDLTKIPCPATCFVAVGPRRVTEAARLLQGYQGPIILLENDDKCVDLVKATLGQENIFFAIPDVIASNTASAEHLELDPLALHTEQGVLYVDARARCVEGEINYCSEEELGRQWVAKSCLHNTPHCIAAYLGALLQRKYIHEAMAIPCAKAVVNGSIDEMLKALKLGWDIPHVFLDWYAEKELKRFSNNRLCDPVARVAREPFRKLHLDGRLVGAALMCMRVGFVPVNILLGIVAALFYDEGSDPDRHILFAKEFLPPEILFSYLLGLRPGEPLHSILTENISELISRLQKIKKSTPR